MGGGIRYVEDLGPAMLKVPYSRYCFMVNNDVQNPGRNKTELRNTYELEALILQKRTRRTIFCCCLFFYIPYVYIVMVTVRLAFPPSPFYV